MERTAGVSEALRYSTAMVVTPPSYLADLNPEQLEAVEHGDGPLLIFAGAGSGKTRVLTRRIANLILSRNVSPSQIFAVTFTNKAAREMRQRVAALFRDSLSRSPGDATQQGKLAVRGSAFHQEDSLPIWVSTFHSSCVRILRRHAKLLDFNPHFAIYDTSDSMSAMKRVFKALSVDPKVIEPRTVLSAIDRAKNDYKFPEDLKQEVMFNPRYTELVAELYSSYQEELRKSNAMDFGDLICNVVTLFKLEPKVLERYNEQLQHILVDEYQDTNRVQYLLIRQLTKTHQNICVVGDDDQSIYGFRGANVETILNFRKDFPTAHVVTLQQNYRSTKSILSAANAVIAENTKREKKKMFTENEGGEKLICFRAYDEKDEAEFVAREIVKMMREGVRPSDIAIFYRTNAQSRAIEEALCENGLPYKIFGGNRFYDRKEVKDILAYLRLLINPSDNEAFLRVVNTPARGIGATTLAALSTLAGKKDVPYFELLERAAAGSSFTGVPLAGERNAREAGFPESEALDPPDLDPPEAYPETLEDPRAAGSSSLSGATSAASAPKRSAALARPAAASQSASREALVPPALLKKFAPFLETMAELRSRYEMTLRILADEHGNHNYSDQSAAIAYLLKDIAEQSGYLKSLRVQDSLEAESRIENLEELSRVAVDFAERALEQGETPSIAEFLDRSCLNSDLDESKDEEEKKRQTTDSSDGAGSGSFKAEASNDAHAQESAPNEVRPQAGYLSMMTLHLAKGLEFDVVFLVGLEEGLLPHIRSIDHADDLEEERRLCYVGLTRARRRLYLTRATDRQSFGRSNWYAGEPSRFIWDLPPEHLDDRDSEFLSRY